MSSALCIARMEACSNSKRVCPVREAWASEGSALLTTCAPSTDAEHWSSTKMSTGTLWVLLEVADQTPPEEAPMEPSSSIAVGLKSTFELRRLADVAVPVIVASIRVCGDSEGAVRGQEVEAVHR